MRIRATILFLSLILGCDLKPNEKKIATFCCPIEVEQLKKTTNFLELIKAVDWDYIFQLIADSLPNYASKLPKLKEDFQKSDVYLKPIDSAGAFFRFTNEYSENGFVHLVFELYTYNDFDFVDLKIDEKLKIQDMFIFSIGESVQEAILNEIVRKNVSNSDLKLYALAKLTFRDGDYVKAWNYISLLSEDLKWEYPYRNLMFQIAKSDLEVFSELVNELDHITHDYRYKLYMRLMSAIYLDQFDDILKYVGELKKITGESIILLASEASVALNSENDYRSAIKTYERMVEIAPEFIGGYLALIELHLENSNEDKALEYLQLANSVFNLTISEWIDLLPENSDFVRDNHQK